MNSGRSRNRSGNRGPGLPSSGDGNRRGTDQGAGNAVHVELQSSSVSGARGPQIYAAHAGAEINALIVSPVRIISEAYVIAATAVRSRLRLQAKSVVTAQGVSRGDHANRVPATLRTTPQARSPGQARQRIGKRLT